MTYEHYLASLPRSEQEWENPKPFRSHDEKLCKDCPPESPKVISRRARRCKSCSSRLRWKSARENAAITGKAPSWRVQKISETGT
jgi:hypothetical protein